MSDNKTFVWNDDLIREYGEWYKKTQGNPKELWGKDLFETFKQVKMNCQKVVSVPEYIITSFLHDGTGEDVFFNLGNDGFYRTERYKDESFVAGNFLNNQLGKTYKIFSVKRADGVTFSIGDITNLGRIEKWTVYNNQMIAEFEGGMRSAHLNNLQKVEPKQKVFTTSDGKDMYFMDGYFSVSDDFSLCFSNAHPNYITEILSKRTFSTKEKAEEYILHNKPCLSINDIIGATKAPYSIYDTTFFSKLKEIASKTLNS